MYFGGVKDKSDQSIWSLGRQTKGEKTVRHIVLWKNGPLSWRSDDKGFSRIIILIACSENVKNYHFVTNLKK